jgi:hypothetical protein
MRPHGPSRKKGTTGQPRLLVRLRAVWRQLYEAAHTRQRVTDRPTNHNRDIMSNEESADDDASLRREHQALMAEHQALSKCPADSEAFRAHAAKLFAHVARLKARIAAFRKERT